MDASQDEVKENIPSGFQSIFIIPKGEKKVKTGISDFMVAFVLWTNQAAEEN